MPVELRTTEASETFGALLSAVARVREVLAEEMDAETGMSLDRYGILLMLSQAEDAAMRPSELSDALPLTRSGTTRLIDRLERDGLVERRTCKSDRRGSYVALTAAGEQIFRRAGRVHLRGIDEHVGAQLSTSEMADLRRLLSKLTDGASDDPAQTPGLASRH